MKQERQSSQNRAGMWPVLTSAGAVLSPAAQHQEVKGASQAVGWERGMAPPWTSSVTLHKFI